MKKNSSRHYNLRISKVSFKSSVNYTSDHTCEKVLLYLLEREI